MPSETQNSTGSVRSSDKIEEDTLTRMKVNEEQTSPYPDRPGERDCEFFLRTGQCGYGNSCRYNHPLTHLPQAVLYPKGELPERTGEPDCEYYLKTGACKYGSTCKYHHPKDRNGAEPVLFNVLGYPMRQGEKSCPYYMQTGMCRFGVACKFHHPHPQPHNGHSTTYGMYSFPYGMMMSLPPATYGVMPPPQAYMPFVFAPPQGWSPYMAGSNVKTQPERVECRFFMNTGTCKYGDDCKYSHPNLPHLPIVVLPARPGQPACGNFKAYGFCKYGQNCKYDHPMPLNPYNMTMPSLPVSTHPRSSPPPPSRSYSTAISNGDKSASAESNSSEIGKQEDISDKSEVQDSSSQLSRSELTVISNGAENHSSEIEKQEEDISDKSELQESSQVSQSDSTALSNGKTDAESPISETKKQGDNPSQPDN